MAFHEVVFPESLAYGATGGPQFSTDVVVLSSGQEKRNSNWSNARGLWQVGKNMKTDAEFDELLDFFRARRGRAHGFLFKDHTDFSTASFTGYLGLGKAATGTYQAVKEYPGMQSSGDLAVGTEYTFRAIGDNPDFSNVGAGAAPYTQGATFAATASTPTDWGDSGEEVLLIPSWAESRKIEKPKSGTLTLTAISDDRTAAPVTLAETTNYTVDYTTGIITLVTNVTTTWLVLAQMEYYVPARFDTDAMPATYESFLRKNWPDIPIVELLS